MFRSSSKVIANPMVQQKVISQTSIIFILNVYRSKTTRSRPTSFRRRCKLSRKRLCSRPRTTICSVQNSKTFRLNPASKTKIFNTLLIIRTLLTNHSKTFKSSSNKIRIQEIRCQSGSKSSITIWMTSNMSLRIQMRGLKISIWRITNPRTLRRSKTGGVLNVRGKEIPPTKTMPILAIMMTMMISMAVK